MAIEMSHRRWLPISMKLKRPGLNPVLIKELRSRMRGPRAFLILTGFLLLLSGIAFLLYKTLEASFQYAYGPSGMSAMVGVSMFLGLAFFELFLVAFITPALTAGTISGEHESLTYEMLVATPLRASSIMFGKMVAALSYVFLLIFAAVPMLSLVYIFGGVTVRDVAVALLVLVVTTVTFGTLGMFWSALLQRTGRATVMSYLTLLTFIMGPYVLFSVWAVLQRQTPPPALLYANPFTAMMSVVGMGPDQGMIFGALNLPFLFGLMGGGMGFGAPPVEYNHPAWHWTLALYTLLTVVLGLLTVVLVRPVGQRRITLPQVLLALLLVGTIVGGLSQVFTAEDWKQILDSPDEVIRLMKG
ncbi:MAG: ABC transporter permease [Chloroflexota bacterium]|nr:ABC transporter permease [Chloroflexota bacterium]